MSLAARFSRPLAVSVLVLAAVPLTGWVIGGATNFEWSIAVGIAGTGSIGALLILKRPDNAVGGILGLIAVSGGIAGLTVIVLPDTTPEVVPPWQAGVWALAAASWFGFLLLLAGFLPLLFPTGSVPSPRWRWLLPFGIAVSAVVTFINLFQEELCVDTAETCEQFAANPIGIAGVPSLEYSPAGAVVLSAAALFIFSALTSLVVRFVRARGVERLQLKWVTFAFAAFVVVMFAEDALGWAGVDIAGVPPYVLISQVGWVVIPASAAVAILRYRLYEIDRIISRTVGYSLVVGLVAAVYGLFVVGIPVLLPAARGSELLVAGATLVAFVVFNPVRRRLLRGVDRRFNRSRYDVERVIDDFAARLRGRVDATDVVTGCATVASETMQPSTIAVWVRQP